MQMRCRSPSGSVTTWAWHGILKEVKQILHQNDVIINGKPCRDPKMGIGIFDIIALPEDQQVLPHPP